MSRTKASGSAAENVGEADDKSTSTTKTETSVVGAGNPQADAGVTNEEVNVGEAKSDLEKASTGASDPDAGAAGATQGAGDSNLSTEDGAGASEDIQVALKEVPKYTIHKTVAAMKIERVTHKPNPDEEDRTQQASYGAILHFEGGEFPDAHVDSDFVVKYRPQPGGYAVSDEKGNASYIPGDEFEANYKASK